MPALHRSSAEGAHGIRCPKIKSQELCAWNLYCSYGLKLHWHITLLFWTKIPAEFSPNFLFQLSSIERPDRLGAHTHTHSVTAIWDVTHIASVSLLASVVWPRWTRCSESWRTGQPAQPAAVRSVSKLGLSAMCFGDIVAAVFAALLSHYVTEVIIRRHHPVEALVTWRVSVQPCVKRHLNTCVHLAVNTCLRDRQECWLMARVEL